MFGSRARESHGCALCQASRSPAFTSGYREVNTSEYTRFWPSARDKLKSNAHKLLWKTIRAGDMPHPSTLICADCGIQAECYDHRDYAMPLDVDPVCKGCNNRRGPGLPLITKIDERKHKLDVSHVDIEGDGYSPLEARLVGTTTTEVADADARLTILYTARESSAYFANSSLLASIASGYSCRIASEARAQYFKQRDPWYW